MIFVESNKNTKAFKTPKKICNVPNTPGVPVGTFINFGSGMSAPYNKLSNFNECTITGKIHVMVGFNEYSPKEFTFPSSEHFWWAHFLVRECDVKRLAINGDLSTLETGLPLLLEGDKLRRALEYWPKKNNVGIVAKLLAGKNGSSYRKRAMKLGIQMSVHPCVKYGPQGADRTLSKIWTSILVAKYTQNSGHRQVLIGTGDHHLVEFTKSSSERVSSEFWAGRVIGGKLYGKNYMGDCMMSIRETIMFMR